MNPYMERARAQDAPPPGLLGGIDDGDSIPFSHSVHRYFPAADALIGEWDSLAGRLHALPYLQFGWAQAWWRAFGLGEPELRVVRRGSHLVGLLPVVRRNKILESAANYHTPGFGLLAEGRAAAAVLAEALFAEQPTHISLTSLNLQEQTLDVCRAAAEAAGYRAVIRPFARAPYLDVQGTWEDYEDSLSDNLLRDLRKCGRALGREGKVHVDVVCGGEHVDERLREAFLVEASGWKGAAGTAILSDPRTQRFYTAVGRWAAERGTLRLFMLRVDCRPLAMCFALQAHGSCHLLKMGYDPAYGRYSPGKLLMRAVLRECFRSGVSRVEFNGDAEPYKFSWTETVHEYERLEAFSPTMAGQLAWAAFTYSRPVANRLRERLGLPPLEH